MKGRTITKILPLVLLPCYYFFISNNQHLPGTSRDVSAEGVTGIATSTAYMTTNHTLWGNTNNSMPVTNMSVKNISVDTNDHSNDEEFNKNNESKQPIKLNRIYLDHLQSLKPIPKKVHMFFPDKDYWRKDKPLPFVEHSILSLMKLNPDWNVTVYDDAMIDEIIKNAGNASIIPKEEVDILLDAHIVERTDIARLLLMYSEGGMYIDIDRLNNKMISDVIHKNTRLCLVSSSIVEA